MRPFSVCIAAQNEEKTLLHTVDSIRRTDLWNSTEPEDREILICPNVCSDRTETIALELAAKNPGIRCFVQGRRGKSAALAYLSTKSMEHAECLFFVDADIKLAPDCLTLLERQLLYDDDALLVGAAVRAVPEHQANYSFYQRRYSRFINSEPYQQYICDRGFVAGACYGMRRRQAKYIWPRMPQDVRLADDSLLNALLGRAAVRYVPEARVYVQPPNFIDSVREWTRHFASGMLIDRFHPALSEQLREFKATKRKRDYFKALPLSLKLFSLTRPLVRLLAKPCARRRLRLGEDTWSVLASTKQST